MMFGSLLVVLLLIGTCWGRSTGPPLPEACQNQLVPQHGTNAPQSSGSAPYSIDVESETSYVAGATLTVTVIGNSSESDLGIFKGFMIQARANENGEAFGTFRLLPNDEKSKLFGCPVVTEFNTASHKNPDPVELVSLNWQASPAQLETITQFRFYYTVVHNYTTFWVKLSSDLIQVGGSETVAAGTTESTTIAANNGTGNICVRESYSLQLIKSHGCVMCFAWGLLAPVGILIAMFYKVVWPNGEWFYSHLGIMIGVLVFTIAGLVLILVHASGRWLSSTPINFPHQVFGIIAAAAVGVNPFIAILRCDPNSPWRWIYNWTHGLTGLFLGQIAAFCAMLLGLNIYRECADNKDFVHYAIYTVSATIGAVFSVMAFYNIYAVNYRTRHSEPKDLISGSELPGSFPSFSKNFKTEHLDEDDDELNEPSEDYPLRAACGVGILVLLFLLTVASIALLALT